MTKQTKILISVVLSCTILLLLFIPSFAENSTYTLEAGTYVFSSTPVLPLSDFTLELDFTSSVVSSEYSINSTLYGTSIQVGNNSISPSFGMVYFGSFAPPIPGIDGGIEAVLESNFTFDSLRTIHINTPVDVSYEVHSFFSSNTTFTPDYEGNPFTDIMNLIVEALDVPLFGSFSLWNMLTAICGLFAVVWLLKLLAGG